HQPLDCEPRRGERFDRSGKRTAVVPDGARPLPIVLNRLDLEISRGVESNRISGWLMCRKHQPASRLEYPPEFSKRGTPIAQVMQNERADDAVEGGIRRKGQRFSEIGDLEFDALSQVTRRCRGEALARVSNHRGARVD